MSQPSADHDNFELASELLNEFGNRGFQRTSMTSLARAAGVARQTLYNRFGRKDAVLEWAVEVQVRGLRARALACLEDETEPIAEALLNAFCAWLGPVVELARRGRHGQEILGLGGAARRRSPSSPLDAFATELSTILRARSPERRRSADDTAFALMMAAKGLVPGSESVAEFRESMARVLRGAGFEPSSKTPSGSGP